MMKTYFEAQNLKDLWFVNYNNFYGELAVIVRAPGGFGDAIAQVTEKFPVDEKHPPQIHATPVKDLVFIDNLLVLADYRE